jgi:hypothetical protein
MGVSVALSVLRSINTWLLGLALVMLVPVLVLAVEVLAAPWPIRRTAWAASTISSGHDFHSCRSLGLIIGPP